MVTEAPTPASDTYRAFFHFAILANAPFSQATKAANSPFFMLNHLPADNSKDMLQSTFWLFLPRTNPAGRPRRPITFIRSAAEGK